MSFADRFRDHLLPDKLHILNVSFLANELRRELGGCGGNIAYNLRLLGDPAVLMATVGHDFSTYAQHLSVCGVDISHVRVVATEHTAQAFITTDVENNQITAFHPGAMQHAHQNRVSDAAGISIGIVAPDGRQGMIDHAAQFEAAGVPFIFDPGQGLPMFDGAELANFIHRAHWVAVNDYEWQLLSHRTGYSIDDVLRYVEALIVTQGAAGSTIHARNASITIPAVNAQKIVDPTGCGDAYRAGLIHGLRRGLDWETTGRIASLAGAIKIESRGTQNHKFTSAEFAQRYQTAFCETLSLEAWPAGQLDTTHRSISFEREGH